MMNETLIRLGDYLQRVVGTAWLAVLLTDTVVAAHACST